MDDLLMLDASSEEEACWLSAAELERERAVVWLRQAESIAAGYAKAAAAGRAEFAVLEVSCALGIDQISADRVLTEARQLVDLPQVREAVETGLLRQPHAQALLGQLLTLDSALAGPVADEVLTKAADRTPAQLRAIARRAVLDADPTAAERRRRQAVAQRQMFLRPLDDGMMSLELHLRAESALRVYGRATDATRLDDGSGRNADQRRVDWVVEQILAERGLVTQPPPGADGPDADGPDADGPAGPSGDESASGGGLDRRRRRPVQVQVMVPVAVALGLSEEPCELVGYGPISAQHGTELLAEAELRKVCVDARTGQVVAADDRVVRPVPADAPGGMTADRAQALAEAVREAVVDMVLSSSFAPEPEPGYRPSAHLERTVQLRDVTSDFPFASTPAWLCDSDHTRPFHLRGETSLENLGSRSRRGHRAKQAGWTPRPDADGSQLWESPSGRSYRRPPARPLPPKIPPDAVLPPPRPPRRDADPPPRPLEIAPPDTPPPDAPSSSLPTNQPPEQDDDRPPF